MNIFEYKEAVKTLRQYCKNHDLDITVSFKNRKGKYYVNLEYKKFWNLHKSMFDVAKPLVNFYFEKARMTSGCTSYCTFRINP